MSFSKYIQDEIVRTIQKDFDFPLEDRLVVIAELDKFKYKEDESIWEQHKGKTSHEFEVYFDGEFLCFFNKNETQDSVRLKILEGLKDTYQSGKIVFNKHLRDETIKLEEENRKQANTVTLKKGTTPGEKIVNEAIKRASEKGGKNVVVK